jgi:hypothetical protein
MSLPYNYIPIVIDDDWGLMGIIPPGLKKIADSIDSEEESNVFETDLKNLSQEIIENKMSQKGPEALNFGNLQKMNNSMLTDDDQVDIDDMNSPTKLISKLAPIITRINNPPPQSNRTKISEYSDETNHNHENEIFMVPKSNPNILTGITIDEIPVTRSFLRRENFNEINTTGNSASNSNRSDTSNFLDNLSSLAVVRNKNSFLVGLGK